MSKAGIIANPASGKDIRWLVAYAGGGKTGLFHQAELD